MTVDMIATGTDVKPLECVFFLRDVRSASYFEQMKGRGARTISNADFQSVTPDAQAKTRFVLVDAITAHRVLICTPPPEHPLVDLDGPARQDRLLPGRPSRLRRLDRAAG